MKIWIELEHNGVKSIYENELDFCDNWALAYASLVRIVSGQLTPYQEVHFINAGIEGVSTKILYPDDFKLYGYMSASHACKIAAEVLIDQLLWSRQ